MRVKNRYAFVHAFIAVRAAAAFAVLALFIYAYFSPSIDSNAILERLTSLQFSAALYNTGILALPVIVLLIITLLFGRLFCSVLCPLGTAQELLWRLKLLILKSDKPQNRKPQKINLRFIPALLAGVAAAFLATPFVIILDPFSTFGSGLTAIKTILGGHYEVLLTVFFAGFLAILAVAFFRGRSFCRWCPVGFTLGVFSRFSLFRVRVRQGCASCGKCEKSCPTHCISSYNDASKNTRQPARISAEDCVLCLSCIKSCPSKNIHYTPRLFKSSNAKIKSTRRDFIKHALAVTGGAAYLLGPSIKFLFPSAGRNTIAEKTAVYILPPGAKDAKNFFSHCISCHACAAACPVKILKPAESPHPMLDYSSAGCQFNCTECGRVCPTDAIHRLDLEEKQRTRIALSRLDFLLCVVKTKSQSCGACAEICPTGALTMVPYDEAGIGFLTRPVLDEQYCIGCGACLSACPAEPRAIKIAAVPKQSLTAGTRPSEDSGDSLTVSTEDFPF